MKQQFMKYWGSLKEQEQQLIMVAGGVFIIFVLVMGIFRPLNTAIENAQQSQIKQQELLAWVDDSIVKLKAAGKAQAVSNQNLSQIVNNTRGRYSINISKMQMRPTVWAFARSISILFTVYRFKQKRALPIPCAK